MKSIKSKLKMNNNVSLSLSEDDINNILFSLAYVNKNDNEADKWQRKKYETLYTNIYKDAAKILGKETLIDNYDLYPDINKVQTRY